MEVSPAVDLKAEQMTSRTQVLTAKQWKSLKVSSKKSGRKNYRWRQKIAPQVLKYNPKLTKNLEVLYRPADQLMETTNHRSRGRIKNHDVPNNSRYRFAAIKQPKF